MCYRTGKYNVCRCVMCIFQPGNLTGRDSEGVKLANRTNIPGLFTSPEDSTLHKAAASRIRPSETSYTNNRFSAYSQDSIRGEHRYSSLNSWQSDLTTTSSQISMPLWMNVALKSRLLGRMISIRFTKEPAEASVLQTKTKDMKGSKECLLILIWHNTTCICYCHTPISLHAIAMPTFFHTLDKRTPQPQAE